MTNLGRRAADAPERSAGARHRVPAPGPALRHALVGYVAAIVLSSLAAAIAAGVSGEVDGLAVLLAGQAAFWAVLVATVGYAVRRAGTGPVVRRIGAEIRWADVPAGVAAGVVLQLVVVPLLYLPFRGLIDEDDLSGPARELFDRVHGPGLVAMGVAVIVVAPLVEELFFRGLLLQALQRRWGAATAVIASSMIFGATHFQPLQFTALTVAGAVFAGAAVRTGRLGPAVVVHAAFNATTFVALVLLG